jgi:hypothetical protein
MALFWTIMIFLIFQILQNTYSFGDVSTYAATFSMLDIGIYLLILFGLVTSLGMNFAILVSDQVYFKPKTLFTVILVCLPFSILGAVLLSNYLQI